MVNVPRLNRNDFVSAGWSCFVDQACVGGGVVEELASTPQIVEDVMDVSNMAPTNWDGVHIGVCLYMIEEEKLSADGLAFER